MKGSCVLRVMIKPGQQRSQRLFYELRCSVTITAGNICYPPLYQPPSPPALKHTTLALTSTPSIHYPTRSPPTLHPNISFMREILRLSYILGVEHLQWNLLDVFIGVFDLNSFNKISSGDESASLLSSWVQETNFSNNSCLSDH